MCWEKSQDLRIGSLATAGRDLRSAFQVDFPFGGHPPSRLTCFAKIVLLLGFPNSITQHMKYRTMMEYYEICWVYHIIVSCNVVSHGFPYYLMANPYKSHIIFRMFQLLPVTVASSETWKKRGGQSFWTSGFVQ